MKYTKSMTSLLRYQKKVLSQEIIIANQTKCSLYQFSCCQFLFNNKRNNTFHQCAESCTKKDVPIRWNLQKLLAHNRLMSQIWKCNARERREDFSGIVNWKITYSVYLFNICQIPLRMNIFADELWIYTGMPNS